MTWRLRGGLVSLAVVLAVLGMAVAGYLITLKLQDDPGICIGVKGCAEVQDSKYGEIAGVPVSIPGFAAYAFLAVAAIAWYRNIAGHRAEIALIGFLVALAGLLMSGYFTYIEAFVLEAWCSWCIVSAVLMTALFAVWSWLLAITMREG